MIRLLDESLEAFLRSEVPLPQGEIDIAFDTPDPEWASTVNQPTVNVFLWDVRRSPDESRSGMVRGSGSGGRQIVPPRIQCRYLVTAWATDMRDEHRMLSSVLTTLLPTHALPEQFLEGQLASVQPLPSLQTASAHVGDFVDFWSALHGKIKAGIDLQVTMTVDVGMKLPAAPPIGALGMDADNPPSMPKRRGGRVDDPMAIGAIVQAPDDATLVADDGTFWIDVWAGEELVVHTDPPMHITVPDTGPILVERSAQSPS
ncbi:MAG: DUF4255 domain-containing protein [Actinomycetota bacterium]